MIAAMLAAIAIAAATGPWIRPPLSEDMTGLDIYLSLSPTIKPTPQTESLHGLPRRLSALNVGVLLIAVAASGLLWSLFRPRQVEILSGLLVCLSLVLVSWVVLSNPLLFELLEGENLERQQIAKYGAKQELDLVLDSERRGTEKINPAHRDPKGLFSGLEYLLVPPWLIGLSAISLLAATRGPLPARLLRLGAWLAIGAIASLIVCGNRLYAELRWRQAQNLEAYGAFRDASDALRGSVTAFPEVALLSRTWRLTGKLDLELGNRTPESRFFTATRLAKRNDLSEAITLLESVVTESNDQPSPARRLLVSLLAQDGLKHYGKGNWAAAHLAFERAVMVSPDRCDAGFFLGVLDGEAFRANPDLVKERFSPCFERASDRALRADMLGVLGDAYFQAGQFAEARNYYFASLRAFNLPKQINYRAQRGLTGF